MNPQENGTSSARHHHSSSSVPSHATDKQKRLYRRSVHGCPYPTTPVNNNTWTPPPKTFPLPQTPTPNNSTNSGFIAQYATPAVHPFSPPPLAPTSSLARRRRSTVSSRPLDILSSATMPPLQTQPNSLQQYTQAQQQRYRQMQSTPDTPQLSTSPQSYWDASSRSSGPGGERSLFVPDEQGIGGSWHGWSTRNSSVSKPEEEIEDDLEAMLHEAMEEDESGVENNIAQGAPTNGLRSSENKDHARREAAESLAKIEQAMVIST